MSIMNHVKIIRIILGVILSVSGIAKIIDPGKAVNLIMEFRIIPGFMAAIIITLLPSIEIATGIFLCTEKYKRLTNCSAVILFTGFLIISIYGTIIGLNSDCGCFGSVMESRVGWGIVVRNGVF